MSKSYRELRLILGDQLNQQHSWFEQRDDGVLYLIAELHQEASYTRHHIQKVCAFFIAMQRFAAMLRERGHQVLYLTLDESAEYADLPALLSATCQRHGIQQFVYQQPDEYRLSEQLQRFSQQSPIECRCIDSEHFYLTQQQLDDYPKAATQAMEVFYRQMRKRFSILLDGEGRPEGGKWNYDKQNRQSIKPEQAASLAQPLTFANPVDEVRQRIERHGIATIGQLGDSLLWPVDRDQAKQLLDFFCTHLLPSFGRFQDAMLSDVDNSWSLSHSRLSFALNCKLLSPGEVVDAALASYHAQPQQIDLAQIEGFVRQILGWREYIRLIYWQLMPEYGQQNTFAALRPLPEYFWTGETKMNCLRQAIGQSLEYAYAHHIQRLMITGNFCLLTGIDPEQVDDWYLGIYIDAIEWVEMPNTRGMALFADGGVLATKPYAASANYVSKMSDYCKGCHYKAKLKTGDQACPLNSFYWHFLHRNQHLLTNNHRLSIAYRNWFLKEPAQQQVILEQAEYYLSQINEL